MKVAFALCVVAVDTVKVTATNLSQKLRNQQKDKKQEKKFKKSLIMIRKQNRIRVKRAKKDYHWCGCDRMMVSPGEKCKSCGVICKKGKRKFKKDVDIDQEDVL